MKPMGFVYEGSQNRVLRLTHALRTGRGTEAECEQ